MIKVQGLSFKKVELPELNDCIHYGQTKVFSESQYRRSPTLSREIENGRVLVVERRDEDSANFKAPEKAVVEEVVREVRIEVPAPSPPPPPPKEVDYKSDEKYESLTDQIALLQKQISSMQVPATESPAPPDQSIASMMEAMMERLNSLSEKVERKEELPQPAAQSPDTGTANALAEISKKLDSLSFSGPGIASKPKDVGGLSIKEEKYIPDISVTDMSNHVNLSAKSIGHGGQVNESLAALRKLKQAGK